MGSVYKKTVTRPIPSGAEITTKAGEQFARWKPRTGRVKTAPIVAGADGTLKIRTLSGTYVAEYRDGSGIVRIVSTGCRDESAARSKLAELERRAELVKAGVLTAEEDSIADQQSVPLADHFGEYLTHLRSKGTCEKHRGNVRRNLNRVAMDCDWRKLRDMTRSALEKWTLKRIDDGMSARTRNAHLEAAIAFGNWCIESSRMTTNPFARIGKANEQADPRRKRRALTPDELGRLLLVARWRPLAEQGRASVAVESNDSGKRSNWCKAELTFDGLAEAVRVARQRLANNPEFAGACDLEGRERALVYKTLALTGLRSGELASMTVGQVVLDSALPHMALNASDEKNREGSTIPLRGDLAIDIRGWIADTMRIDPSRKLFKIPTGLIRILDLDLAAAGIAKRDVRGRTIDVHALRHTFGSLLSAGGVSPRTAQAAMRHSSIDLTMNVYTDPQSLDVLGALNSLPTMTLDSQFSAQQGAIQAGGDESLVAVTVAVNSVQTSHKLSLPVIQLAVDSAMGFTADDNENQVKSLKSSPFSGLRSNGDKKRAKGFEPSTYSLGSCHSTN